MKNRITKVKNTLAGLSGRIRNAEDLSELQDGMVEITAMKKNKEERLKRKKTSVITLNTKHPRYRGSRRKRERM